MASSDLTSNDSTDENGSLDLNDVGLGDIGFMFDSHQPTTTRHLQWSLPGHAAKPIHAMLQAIDDTPGALQSGHYLWPGAELLVDFVTGKLAAEPEPCYYARHQPSSIIELGAGCALASIAALQIWQASLQCLVVTDHDPGVVERARDNHESTIQAILEQSTTDSDLNACINNLGSIPVSFEQLEWGKTEEYPKIRSILAEHTIPVATKVDLILATDVIYDASVVAPLFTTAAALGRRMLMSQSFAYNEHTEAEIVRMCYELTLTRTILYESADGKERIQEFVNDSGE